MNSLRISRKVVQSFSCLQRKKFQQFGQGCFRLFCSKDGNGDKDTGSKLPTKIEQDKSLKKRDKFTLIRDPVFREKLDEIKDDFREAMIKRRDERNNRVWVPANFDHLVIGGGITGLSTAYWLKQAWGNALTVGVVERDMTYSQSTTMTSVGGLRMQFSLPENIRMSMFTADFIRNIRHHLTVLNIDPPDVQFTPMSYLFLASEEGADTLRTNHETQTSCGAKVALMTQAQLKERFPWLNVDDVSLGCYGLENEGIFDPHLMIAALKAKCLEAGVQFVHGEVVDFATEDIDDIVIRKEKRKQLEFCMIKATTGKVYKTKSVMFYNCAGPMAGHVGRLAGLGTGKGVLSVPIPVEPRKRFVYVVHCPNGPGLDTPFLIDHSGVYVRREGLGGNYICGASPPQNWPEPDCSNADVDYEFFEDFVWPSLAQRAPCFEQLKDYEGSENQWFDEKVHSALQHRVPAFTNLELKSAWSGFYDYNTMDQNLIIGNHPLYRNFYMGCGSSGHGLQHGVAIGRALADMTQKCEDPFKLGRFSFDRVLYNEPVFETNIV